MFLVQSLFSFLFALFWASCSQKESVWPFLLPFVFSLNYSWSKRESSRNLTFKVERTRASLIRIPQCGSLWVRENMSKLINLSRKHYWPGSFAESVPLLPPHFSSVLPGHITGHCGTVWMPLHTVSSLSMCWCGFLSHCSCTATHTCSQGGGGCSQGTHCSAGLEQLRADEIWFLLVFFPSFRWRNPFRMLKQQNRLEILLYSASFSFRLPKGTHWGLVSCDSWKEIIVCMCVCMYV